MPVRPALAKWMSMDSAMPSGAVGPFTVSVTGTGSEMEWLTARFPSRKVAIGHRGTLEANWHRATAGDS